MTGGQAKGGGRGAVPVSVIIPCYNAEQYLLDLLRSVRAQTEPADEVVAVESFSTDRTLEILDSFRASLPLRIERTPKAGIYPAWNAGVRLASHELCYVACADDLLYPELVRRLRVLRRAAPECGLYTWRVDTVDGQGRMVTGRGTPILDLLWGGWMERAHVRPGAADALTALTIGSPYLSMMAAAFTKALWQQAGEFPKHYGSAGDVAWQIQAGLRTRVAALPDSLAAWRVHELGATALSQGDKEIQNLSSILQDALPGVLDALGLSGSPRERLAAELRALALDSRILVQFTRLKLGTLVRGLGSLRRQAGIADIASLAVRLLAARLAGPRPGSIAIPASRLRRLLELAGVGHPEPLDVPVDASDGGTAS